MKTLLANSARLLLLFLSVLQSRAYEFAHDTTLDFLKTTDSFLSLSSSKSLIFQVKNIGDINGDGVDDLIVNDIDGNHHGEPFHGLTYIVFGSQGIPSSIDLDNLLVNGQGFTINGDGYSSIVGFVSPAGDIDDDGIDDFILGSYCSAYVIFGRRDGFTDINITNLTQSQGFKIYPGDTMDLYSCFFLSVSNAGDFNNDGIDDIMIGYMNESPLNRHNAGSIYIIFGHPGTFSDLNLTHFANGTQGLKIIGQTAEYLGVTVSSVGDFNGDGIDDVAITTNPSYYSGSSIDNKLYVIYGHEGEFQDLDLSTLTEDQGIQVTDRTNNKHWIVANAGDFDGDGLNDVVFSQTGFGHASEDTILYVLFGTQGRYNNFDLNDLHDTQDTRVLKIISSSGYKGAHHLVNSVDVNSDGLSDLLFGVREEFQVVYGRNQRISEIDLDSLTPAEGFKITNVISGYTYYFFMDCLDFNNDGEIDFVIGTEAVSLIYGGILPKYEINIATIVAGVALPFVLVLLGIYIIQRRSLKRKADDANNMGPIPQTANQDSPTTLSCPIPPVSSTREVALTLFKTQETGETQLTSNSQQIDDGEDQQNQQELCLSSSFEQTGPDLEASPELLIKCSQAVH